MPKFTRIETVEAVQNTPEDREDLLALIRKAGQAPCVRDEKGLEGTVSWWDGDYGNHVAPGEWVVLDEVLSLHIRTDDEMAEEGYVEAGTPAPSVWVVTHQSDDGHVHRETVMGEFGYFTDEASCEQFVKDQWVHWDDSAQLSRPDGYNSYYAEEIEPYKEAK